MLNKVKTTPMTNTHIVGLICAGLLSTPHNIFTFTYFHKMHRCLLDLKKTNNKWPVITVHVRIPVGMIDSKTQFNGTPRKEYAVSPVAQRFPATLASYLIHASNKSSGLLSLTLQYLQNISASHA